MTSIIGQVRDAMERRGWNDVDLAKATGITVQQIGKILNKKRPFRPDDLWKIDNVLCLKLDLAHYVSR